MPYGNPATWQQSLANGEAITRVIEEGSLDVASHRVVSPGRGALHLFATLMTLRTGVHGHGSIPLSHSGNVSTRIGVQQQMKITSKLQSTITLFQYLSTVWSTVS